MVQLSETVMALGICVALPVSVVLLVTRLLMNNTNKRTELLLAALDKNPNLDVEEFLCKRAPRRKTIKDKLLRRLAIGTVLTLLGCGMTGVGIWGTMRHVDENPHLREGDIDIQIVSNGTTSYVGKNPHLLIFMAIPLQAVGIGLIIYFLTGRRMLADEMAAENKRKSNA